MKFSLRNPFCVFGLIVLWRIALLVFTGQPIPANDAFFFDGPVVNWLRHGHYFNPALSVVFPISGHQLYAAYPPLYQLVLVVWMSVFGTSALSAMALHLGLFAVAGFIALAIVARFFPASTNYALAALMFLAVTFNDRPEDLAHMLGMASLLILGRQIAGKPTGLSLALMTFLLLCALYTSVIGGALYFGAGLVAAGIAWVVQRKTWLLVPYFMAAALFVVVTCAIARFEPLWWAGFLENARQTPVHTTGFRMPQVAEIIKLIRNAPVFLLGLLLVPVMLLRWKQIFSETEPWPFLFAGVFVMGWVLLLADMTLLAANYVMYVVYLQVIVAAGLLALGQKYFPAKRCLLSGVMAGCVLLVSVRAIGMTTWGGACAWHNSYWQTQRTLRTELQPFTTNDTPVVLSSCYLYTAVNLGVKNPVHSDWFFDRALPSPDADLAGIESLRPAKLILNQFDYYRAFVPLLARLRQQPGLVTIDVHDESTTRTPDSIPSLQRVVQHISWAPVIVDLEWGK